MPYTAIIMKLLFSRFPEQKSDRIHLKKGKYYYLEAYQKADKLADCASVAVELPSGHFEGPIKRVHLSWRLPGKKPQSGLININEDLFIREQISTFIEQQ